ncbi:MAG: hypothetical protein PW786_04025 [Arachidicoccus sp.]|nr:hypothetical protein [Arachidicoccus sp.]
MKKVLFLAFAAIITSVVISSCSHNDSYDSTYSLLTMQSAQIDSFVLANGLDMTNDQISNASGVVSNLYSWGDTTKKVSQDSSVVNFTISVWGINNQLYYTSSDSTLKFDFVNTSSNSTLVNNLIYSSGSILYYYLSILGTGGQIDFITPSLYQYGSTSVTLGNQTIPANSPIYYQLQIKSITTSSASAVN